jgi:hypothetical protein
MSNVMTAVIPKLLAQGLLALRQQAVMPRLVNRGYEPMAGLKGSSIDVPIPSAVAAVAVTPATVPPANADMGPTSVNIALDQWYEAPFYLTDKEVMDVMAGIVPMQASEAVKSLANKVDIHLLQQGNKVAGFAGTAGTTPFATDLSAYLAARKVLNRNLAPMDNRSVVLDVDAEANAIGLRAFQDAAFRGDTQGIINGQIGYKLGAMWTMDQNVQSFTPRTRRRTRRATPSARPSSRSPPRARARCSSATSSSSPGIRTSTTSCRAMPTSRTAAPSPSAAAG